MLDSTSPDKLQVAGDIDVEKILITTSRGFYQDIRNQVIGLQIFEDIYAPFITGTLMVLDSLDLLNVFPLIGEEYLHLKLSTPSLERGNIDSKFYIHKMSDRIPTGDRGFAYQLHFISEEALIDLNKKISKSFGGKCSDIAQKILTDEQYGFQLKNVIIEPTSNHTKFTSNFWSPVKNINAVCDTAINMNGSASYLFFQDRYNYNFVSLESLYKTEIYQEFRYDNYVRDIRTDGTDVRNINEDYKRIRDLKIPVAYDYIERTRNGMYGSKLYTYDITTKRVVSKNYDMLQNYSNQFHLNQYPIASNSAVYRYNSLIITMPKMSESYSGYGDVTNAGSIQNRVSLMEQIKSYKLTIIVPGRLDYTVGLRILLTLYKKEPTREEDTDIIDDMYSGTYIISAINHYISRNQHECTLEIVKESILKDLNKV